MFTRDSDGKYLLFFRRRLFRASRSKDGGRADFTARREENLAKAPILLRDAKRTRRRREVYCATRREIGDAYDFFLHCDHLSKKFFIRFLFSSDLHTTGPIKGPKRKENP